MGIVEEYMLGIEAAIKEFGTIGDEVYYIAKNEEGWVPRISNRGVLSWSFEDLKYCEGSELSGMEFFIGKKNQIRYILLML